ncbi:MAG: glycosyltransferase [Acidobacteria bacterium]|nr:MAG: glycosyltransferase [Acidobacteriota bacterium]
MSIGVLQPTFDRWGGAEWFIHGLLEQLEARGHEVVLYTHRWSPPPGGGARYAVVEHRYGGVLSHPWDWRRIARTLAGRWSEHDVLFVHNYPATLWYAEAHARGGAPPAVWYCHEPPAALHDPAAAAPDLPLTGAAGGRWAALRFYRSRALWRLVSRLRARTGKAPGREELIDRERAAVGLFRAVLANSRFTADRVERLYGRRAEVVPPVPADLHRLAPAAPPRKEPLVLWVGRLTEAKRPLLMLDAWREARRREPAVRAHRLLIVGEGPLAEEVARRVREDRSAAHASRLPREELVARYRAARLTVHLGRDEPFGLVPVEAMACGCAVLAAAEGGVVETVEPGVTGHLIERPDRDALAARLAALLREPEALDRMGAAAARRVRARFDPSATLAAVERALATARADKSAGGGDPPRRVPTPPVRS